MFDWLIQNQYLIMILQVGVTLLVVPIISNKMFINTALNYGLKTYPKAASDLAACLNFATKIYWGVVAVFFSVASALVLHAIINEAELLNWDNQSGLMLLYLLAMIPVVVMVFMHKRLFKVLKTHAGSMRSASLKPRSLKNFISFPLLALIIAANLIFISTVIYFVQHPFDGFAGYTNLFALLILDALFILIIIVVFKDNKTGTFSNPDHRDAFKRKAIHINMLILALALLHISLSMWISGTEFEEYKLIAQSLYLQLVLVITAATFTLPRAMFQKNAD